MSEPVDVEEWIGGAQRTHRSVTIYQRADLIAELDDLQRRIQNAEDARTAGDEDAEARIDGLTARWKAAAERFRDSALTIQVRGLTAAEAKEIIDRGKLEKASEDEVGARLLAASIVDPPMSVEQLYRLREAVGDPQADKLAAAYSIATRVVPPEPHSSPLPKEPADG